MQTPCFIQFNKPSECSWKAYAILFELLFVLLQIQITCVDVIRGVCWGNKNTKANYWRYFEALFSTSW